MAATDRLRPGAGAARDTRVAASESADALQKRLGYRFAQPALLSRALTHRSFSADHNERLEFLGDAVLDLAVSHLLFERLGAAGEGELSRLRAQLVRKESLHPLAAELGLAPLLKLGEGEVRSGGRQRPSILADALEAVIGAVYLDGGADAADALVRRLFGRVELTAELSAAAKDAKTALQEWLHARKWEPPRYEVVRLTGAAHEQRFEVRCHVDERALATPGEGASRRAAEQAAARAALQILHSESEP